ncbi:MAG TPA: DedA family protein [Candidatus Limnocylindria bacterium]|nr:DedA family protein [Candidatus Limnocylindria bacterium]
MQRKAEFPHRLNFDSVAMELIRQILDVILHLQTHLNDLLTNYGPWFYALLFAVIFCETGLVITPFLPGDSLLFAVGALAADAKSGLNIWVCAGAIAAAAFLGDNVNYWVGKLLGKTLVRRFPRLVKPEHLEKTHRFFEKYGPKTIVMARFVPIVRTFTPFVAGLGTMPYPRFIAMSLFATGLWVGLILPCGYFFGNLPFVKKHFELIVLGIIGVSLLPMVIEWWRSRSNTAK